MPPEGVSKGKHEVQRTRAYPWWLRQRQTPLSPRHTCPATRGRTHSVENIGTTKLLMYRHIPHEGRWEGRKRPLERSRE